MQLEEFYDYKNRFMEDMLTNQKIVALLNPSVSVENAARLAYTQVFPFEFVPETVEDAKTYICFDVDIQKAANKTFYYPTLLVWVFTHKSLLRLPEGGVRTDKLCAEIAKAVDGSRYYGLGELELNMVKRFAPMTDYHGKVLTFNAKDFKRVSPSGQPIPSNRKTG